jgi:hypothetical protein
VQDTFPAYYVQTDPRMKFVKRHPITLFCLTAVLAILIAAHLLAPVFILRKLNAHLAEFSPVYSAHIQSLQLNFLRMAYKFRGLEARLKSDHRRFLKIDEVDVSIAWRELLHGRILTDVVVNGADAVLTHKLFANSQAPEATPKEDAGHLADELFPLRISRVELRHSAFQFADLIKQPESERWKVSGIEGRVINLNPSREVPLTFFTLQGSMRESPLFKLAGKAKREAKPVAWKADLEMRGFDLKAANPIFLKILPLSFTAGKMDLFAEALSKGGEIDGYAKPFFKNIHMIGNKSDFKGLKHFGVEILTVIADFILRKPDDKTVAMRVPFKMAGGKLKVDQAEALSTAIDHGFGDPLRKSVEDRYDLN